MHNRTYVLLDSGSVWEFRGMTPGGMARLWAIDGVASMCVPVSYITSVA